MVTRKDGVWFRTRSRQRREKARRRRRVLQRAVNLTHGCLLSNLKCETGLARIRQQPKSLGLSRRPLGWPLPASARGAYERHIHPRRSRQTNNSALQDQARALSKARAESSKRLGNGGGEISGTDHGDLRFANAEHGWGGRAADRAARPTTVGPRDKKRNQPAPTNSAGSDRCGAETAVQPIEASSSPPPARRMMLAISTGLENPTTRSRTTSRRSRTSTPCGFHDPFVRRSALVKMPSRKGTGTPRMMGTRAKAETFFRLDSCSVLTRR